jgi:hypothetical protein
MASESKRGVEVGAGFATATPATAFQSDDMQVSKTEYGQAMGKLDLPPADPTGALLEIKRREEVAGIGRVQFDEDGMLKRTKAPARNPGPDTRLPPEIARTKRMQFEHDHAGFFVINLANEKFSTRCIKPNIRVLSFHKTHEQAQRRMFKLMHDQRVTSVPVIVPANYPFMIPYSEKAAMDAPRNKAKLERNFVKYNDYIALRHEEFKRRVGDDDKLQGVMEASTYHRRKIYLARQKEREERRKKDGSALVEKLSSGGDLGLDFAAEAETLFGGSGAGVGAGAGSVPILPEFGDGSGGVSGDGGGEVGADGEAEIRARAREAATDMQLASQSFNDALKRVRVAEEEARKAEAAHAHAAAAEAAAAGDSPADRAAAVDALPDLTAGARGVYDGKPKVATQRLTTAKRLAKQQAQQKKAVAKEKNQRLRAEQPSGVVPAAQCFQSAMRPLLREDLPAHWKASSVAGARRGQTADEWPRDLESRHGKFVVISYVDDIDTPEEDPMYPEAAAMEPIVVIFGGEFETEGKARDYLVKEISCWCTDLDLDVVDMYEWLWPTEVDPDALNEEHRTSNVGFTKELNTVMKQRKRTMETTAEARAQAALAGVPLHETNANDMELPDAADVIKATRPGMWVTDEGVTQYDAEGKPIEGFLDTLPLVGKGFLIDDGSKTFSKAYVEHMLEVEAAQAAAALVGEPGAGGVSSGDVYDLASAVELVAHEATLDTAAKTATKTATKTETKTATKTVTKKTAKAKSGSVGLDVDALPDIGSAL